MKRLLSAVDIKLEEHSLFSPVCSAFYRKYIYKSIDNTAVVA